MIPLAVAALLACDRIVSEPEKEPGLLTFSFATTESRAAGEIPDTNSFLLSIRGKSGTVWSGIYGDAPRSLELSPGDYTVEAVSRVFVEPLFDAPQYGDVQSFAVESGKVTAAHLSCAQLNASVRLHQTAQFIADYPDGTFYIQSSTGTLMYSYGEKRTGYFYPGTIWLVFNYGGVSRILLTRELGAREGLSLRIGTGASVMDLGPVAETYGDGLSIEVDTNVVWKNENYAYGSGNGSGGNAEDLTGAYSVGQARGRASSEEKGVWVYGYIAGGDCSSKSCSFSPPFTSNTNLVLSPDRHTADKESCLSVQLSQGAIRDAINLVDHPDLLGRMVYLKGNLVEKYYGIPGIKDLKEYRLQ